MATAWRRRPCQLPQGRPYDDACTEVGAAPPLLPLAPSLKLPPDQRPLLETSVPLTTPLQQSLDHVARHQPRRLEAHHLADGAAHHRVADADHDHQTEVRALPPPLLLPKLLLLALMLRPLRARRLLLEAVLLPMLLLLLRLRQVHLHQHRHHHLETRLLGGAAHLEHVADAEHDHRRHHLHEERLHEPEPHVPQSRALRPQGEAAPHRCLRTPAAHQVQVEGPFPQARGRRACSVC